MNKLTVNDIEIQGKRVLMRVDFNVPLEGKRVASDKRIRAALPTIQYILDKGGRLILMSHLGRPKGKKIPEMSLKPCVSVLEELLGEKVGFINDCVGSTVETAVEKLENGEVLVLENLRYYKEETDNDPDFAKRLADIGDVYVNDAFGTAHRAHASTEGVTHHIDQCAAGYLLMKEIEFLGTVMKSPQKPFVAVLGGAKITGKIDVIENLLPSVDHLIIGGGMAFTFFKAMGFEIGKSLLEEDKIGLAKTILEKGAKKIALPIDCIVSDYVDFKSKKTGPLQIAARDGISADQMGLDIGPGSVKMFRDILSTARTVVWNGPMGVFEIEETAKGTYAIANILAEITQKGAKTIIGGGDSASAVKNAGVADKISHVSTGGGASLEFLEGKVLPGVAALTDK
ncbi:MAG: phosphoglycerate kinase [Deltaproteobacteria bacterium]|nr:phosphoglycerate kinase [Deltaproteobacteria bacterium]